MRLFLRFPIALLVPLFSLGCGDGVTNATGECDASRQPEVCEVFLLVNEARVDAGVAPLSWDADLGMAAQRHAEDMVAQNYFSHDSLDGRTFMDRVRAQNYAGAPTGENIARGQQTPAAVMDSWMNSTGHRNNILSERSTDIGIGLDGRTWVQVFGRK